MSSVYIYIGWLCRIRQFPGRFGARSSLSFFIIRVLIANLLAHAELSHSLVVVYVETLAHLALIVNVQLAFVPGGYFMDRLGRRFVGMLSLFLLSGPRLLFINSLKWAPDLLE